MSFRDPPICNESKCLMRYIYSQMPAKCGQMLTKCCPKCWPNAGQIPAKCRPIASQMPSKCRPNAGQMPAKCRPNAGQNHDISWFKACLKFPKCLFYSYKMLTKFRWNVCLLPSKCLQNACLMFSKLQNAWKIPGQMLDRGKMTFQSNDAKLIKAF